MKIIAHIGHGKTGTSSIQKTLSLAKEELNAVGAYYLGLNFEFSPVQLFPWQIAGGWPELIKNGPAIAQQQLEEVFKRTIDTLTNEGIQQIIWSNESMLSRFDIVGPILQNLRSPSQTVEIVIYLRRHDAWARSAYLQWGIKHKAYRGIVQGFSKWLESHPINFSKPVKPWLNHQWDNVHIRNFDACEDVVKDFFLCSSIPINLIESRRDNESPGAVALALWAIFNSQNEQPILPYELHNVLQRADVVDKKYQHLDLGSLFPTPENMVHLLESVQQDVASINDIFNAFGQPPFDNKPLKDKVYDVSYEQIFASFLDLLKFQDAENMRQDQEIRKLKRRLRAIEEKLNQ